MTEQSSPRSCKHPLPSLQEIKTRCWSQGAGCTLCVHKKAFMLPSSLLLCILCHSTLNSTAVKTQQTHVNKIHTLPQMGEKLHGSYEQHPSKCWERGGDLSKQTMLGGCSLLYSRHRHCRKTWPYHCSEWSISFPTGTFLWCWPHNLLIKNASLAQERII